jgi:hypothetical protein
MTEEYFIGLSGKLIPKNLIPYPSDDLFNNDIIENNDGDRLLYQDGYFRLIVDRYDYFLSDSKRFSNWVKL